MRPAFTIFHTLTLALFCFGFELNAIQDEPEGEVWFQYKMSLERMACWGLTIHVHEAEKLSLKQIEAFLNASQEIQFKGKTRKQIYHWIEQVLGRQEYHQQSRPARGLLRSYVAKMTGLSRAQVTRWIARYRLQILAL